MNSREIKLSKIDIFSIVAGAIGLFVDIISIVGIFNTSQNSENSPLSNWIVVFILIFYSSILINFYIRRFFENRRIRLSRSVNDRNADNTIFYAFSIFCLPVMTIYFMLALIEFNKFDSSFLIIEDFIFVRLNIYPELHVFVCGLFYGGLLSTLILMCCHLFVREIYKLLS